MTMSVLISTLCRKYRCARTRPADFLCAEVTAMPASLPRLFAFAREHEEQARAGRDELRTELWNDVIDHLLDRRSPQLLTVET